MKSYVKNNLIKGLLTPPKANIKILSITFIYATIALVVGFYSKIFHVQLIESRLIYILPFTLFIFPSLLEEAFFRGMLIAQDTRKKGIGQTIKMIIWSTTLFILWHPINAMLINHAAIPLFFNPAFLTITAMLGIVCSYSYIMTQSLWAPIMIHWITVMLWVFFLGGRNLILDI